MAKAKITLTGNLERQPKVNEDGTVELFFRIPMSESVPSGLEPLGESVYKVIVNSKIWSKVSSKINNDSTYLIQGEIKAAVNTKGIPFIKVICFDISIIEPQGKNENNKVEGKSFKQEANELQNVKNISLDMSNILKSVPEGTDDIIPLSAITLSDVSNKPNPNNRNNRHAIKLIKSNGYFDTPITVEKNTFRLIAGASYYCAALELGIQNVPVKYHVSAKPKFKKEAPLSNIKWYENDEIIQVSISDIILTERVHLNATEVKLSGFKRIAEEMKIESPVAIRPLESGKYSLIAGFSRFVIAKTLGIEKIPAVVKDVSHDELALKYKLFSQNFSRNPNKKHSPKSDAVINIDEIRIPEEYINNSPNPLKIDQIITSYKNTGFIDKPVVLSKEKKVLLDGYARYVAAKKLGLKEIPVRYRVTDI